MDNLKDPSAALMALSRELAPTMKTIDAKQLTVKKLHSEGLANADKSENNQG